MDQSGLLLILLQQSNIQKFAFLLKAKLAGTSMQSFVSYRAAGYRSICQTNKDDFVIIVEYTQGSTYTKILHNEHGLKWVITNSLDILKRSEDV